MPLNKNLLYRTFNRSYERSQRLADMATRKALDLPLDDEVNITTNNTNSGLQLKHLLGIGVLMLASGLLGGGGLLAVTSLLSHLKTPAGQPAGPGLPTEEYKVTFWTEEGEAIPLREQ